MKTNQSDFPNDYEITNHNKRGRCKDCYQILNINISNGRNKHRNYLGVPIYDPNVHGKAIHPQTEAQCGVIRRVLKFLCLSHIA